MKVSQFVRLCFVLCIPLVIYAIASQDTVHPVIMGYPYVLDGDTIRIDKYKVRLWGIDAEELSEPNGLSAREALMNIIGTEQVTCTLYELSHDRHVGYCVSHTGDIAEALVRMGKALDCWAFSHGKYRQFEPADARYHLLQKPYCENIHESKS